MTITNSRLIVQHNMDKLYCSAIIGGNKRMSECVLINIITRASPVAPPRETRTLVNSPELTLLLRPQLLVDKIDNKTPNV